MTSVRQIDIARAAGVSQATVSTVLTGGAELSRISGETQRRVREVANELGYRVRRSVPATRPRQAHTARPALIGVHTFERTLPTSPTSYYFDFLRGVEECAIATGSNLLLFTAASRGHGHSIFDGGSNMLAAADGSVLLGQGTNRDDLLRLSVEGYPFVHIGRRELTDHPISYVGGDYGSAVSGIVSDLVTMGHRRFGYLGDESSDEAPSERWVGCADALSRFGLAVPAPEFTSAAALSASVIDGALAQGTTVFLVESASLLRVLVAVAALRGVQIPRDLSVVLLINDSPPDLALTHPWATMRIPRLEIGERAVELLLAELNDPEGDHERQLLLPCSWSLDGSTAAPPAP